MASTTACFTLVRRVKMMQNTRGNEEPFEPFSIVYFSNTPSHGYPNFFKIVVITESCDLWKRQPNNQRGGGLCTYIGSRLNVIELSNLCKPDIETQWFPLKMDRLINSTILGTVYHPPQSDDRIFRSHIFNSLNTLLAIYPNFDIMLPEDHFKPANLCFSLKLKKLVI